MAACVLRSKRRQLHCRLCCPCCLLSVLLVVRVACCPLHLVCGMLSVLHVVWHVVCVVCCLLQKRHQLHSELKALLACPCEHIVKMFDAFHGAQAIL